jgi:hypothetical protein
MAWSKPPADIVSVSNLREVMAALEPGRLTLGPYTYLRTSGKPARMRNRSRQIVDDEAVNGYEYGEEGEGRT